MWQLQHGEKYYWFQTDNKAAANKMKRRNKFRLVSYGVNCDHWTFEAIFTRPDIARNALKTLAGNAVKYDKNDDVYFAPIRISDSDNLAA
jgi:hypothetical protein